MSSINQLISEIAHVIGQPNNKSLRRGIKAAIIHTRNELIRQSYEKHGYADRVLNYRYRVSIQPVIDGDIELPEGLDECDFDQIRRTTLKVPRPTRLSNNLPFMRVSSVGFKTNTEFPFVKETSARFINSLPGMGGIPQYDYINDYLYLFNVNHKFEKLEYIVIEAPFENPKEVQKLAGDVGEFDALFGDDDEWFLPEDMVGQLKDIIIKRDMLQQIRETNEVSGKEIVN